MLTHFLVHEPEGQRLVSDERLVVTLYVRNARLAVPAIDERMYYIAHLPFVV